MNQHASVKPDWSTLSTEQRTNALAPMLADGLSGSEMADRFANASRNSIIGHCRRNGMRLQSGLTGKYKVPAQVRTDRARQVSTWNARNKRAAKPGKSQRYVISNGVPTDMAAPPDNRLRNGRAFDPAHAPAGARMLNLMERQAGQCAWPMFRDDDEMLFCAADHAGPGENYCRHHKAMAEVPRGKSFSPPSQPTAATPAPPPMDTRDQHRAGEDTSYGGGAGEAPNGRDGGKKKSAPS